MVFSNGWTMRFGRTSYEPGARKSDFRDWIFAVILGLALLLAPFLAWRVEVAYRDMLVAFREVEDIVMECDERVALSTCAGMGDLVHIVSNRVSGSVQDSDFGVSVSGALKLHRRTEYCQWQEHKHQKCQTCSSGSGKKKKTYRCNCVTTYTYTKGWHNHKILSVLFNQPAAHHNPQRDPYPSASFAASNAKIGEAPVLPELIDNPNEAFRAEKHSIEWTHDAKRTAKWHDPIVRFFGFTPGAKTRFESVHNLRGTEHSRAAQTDGFVYVGRGGYFFSPYTASQAHLLLQYFGEFLEGSLLNWQIGDLMPSCTAGDIRVSYAVQDPAQASVVGAVKAGRGGDALGLYETSRGYQVGVLHEGLREAWEMFDTEATEGKKKVTWARVWLFPFSLIAVKALAVFAGRGFSDWRERALAAVGLEGALVSVIWVAVWRFEMSTINQDVSMVLLGVASLALAYVVFLRTEESPYGDGGLGDVWEWVQDCVNQSQTSSNPNASVKEEEDSEQSKKER